MKIIIFLTVLALSVAGQALNHSVPLGAANGTSDDALDQRENLKTQEDQLEKAIELLRQKQQSIDQQLNNPQGKNPNLNEIDFSLINTTNHVVIDLELSKVQQEEMSPTGPPKYKYEQKHKK